MVEIQKHVVVREVNCDIESTLSRFNELTSIKVTKIINFSKRDLALKNERGMFQLQFLAHPKCNFQNQECKLIASMDKEKHDPPHPRQ